MQEAEMLNSHRLSWLFIELTLQKTPTIVLAELHGARQPLEKVHCGVRRDGVDRDCVAAMRKYKAAFTEYHWALDF